MRKLTDLDLFLFKYCVSQNEKQVNKELGFVTSFPFLRFEMNITQDQLLTSLHSLYGKGYIVVSKNSSMYGKIEDIVITVTQFIKNGRTPIHMKLPLPEYQQRRLDQQRKDYEPQTRDMVRLFEKQEKAPKPIPKPTFKSPTYTQTIKPKPIVKDENSEILSKMIKELEQVEMESKKLRMNGKDISQYKPWPDDEKLDKKWLAILNSRNRMIKYMGKDYYKIKDNSW